MLLEEGMILVLTTGGVTLAQFVPIRSSSKSMAGDPAPVLTLKYARLCALAIVDAELASIMVAEGGVVAPKVDLSGVTHRLTTSPAVERSYLTTSRMFVFSG